MVIGDVVDYLREHLELGYDVADLKLQLVRFGHSPKIVEEALRVLKNEALHALPSPPVPGSISSKANVWLIAPAVLFALLFSIGVIVALLRNTAL
jgi:hypothetical protein